MTAERSDCILLFAVVFEIVADVLFKKWALNSRYLLLYSGLILYFVGTVFWAFSLKHELLSKAVTVFTVFNFVGVVLVGMLFFHEQLSLTNKICIVLGVLSIVLMEL